jgi:hypothetical protein
VVIAPTLEHDMRRRHLQALAVILLQPVVAAADLHVVVVEGLGGNEMYARQFSEQVAAVATASATMTNDNRVRVFAADSASREAILLHLADLAEQTSASDQVAVYLIGHGSYDDHQYKFNISGPDLTDTDLRDALDALPSTNQLLVNTSSASGAMADGLSNDVRLLVLATRSGVERHATRFGNYFVASLNEPGADLDKNQVVSVLEAFQFAERQVDDFFERNDRLATEHARMEGERGDRFGISRLTAGRQSSSESIKDSELDRLTEDRDVLNAEIDELRLARDAMSAEEYQSGLLQKMLELAATEDDIETRERELGIEL